MATSSDLHALKNLFYDWRRETKEICKHMNTLADELDAAFYYANIAKVTGSSVAAAGGVISAVGVGLSFFTFGLSLPLVAVGAVVGVLGGATTVVSTIVVGIKQSGTATKAQESVERYNEIRRNIQKKGLEIGNKLDAADNIDVNYPYWCLFWSNIVFGKDKQETWSGISSAIGTYINASTKTVADGIKTGALVAKTVKDGIASTAAVARTSTAAVAETGVAATKTVITTASKTVVVAAGVGILLMGLDIYQIIDSSIDIYKNNPHQASKAIRQGAADLLDSCPVEAVIDRLIKETDRQLRQ